MSCIRARARRRASRRGVLTFEWILVVTLVVVGLIGGLAAIRNAVLDEMYDLSHAVEAMNFSGGNGNSPSQDTNAPTIPNDGSTWWGSAHR